MFADPDFVGSMEDEDSVYFFFKETAIENSFCGKVSLHPDCANTLRNELSKSGSRILSYLAEIINN